ncbi:zeta toxin family protein [Microbacterium sp.]|uniref:zeta toxin family protein n=1 Tax=Microbacterium sp. TaxID=51671 RepID=UPI00261E880C|nr:zeta toxin family protein [Microbacterium sp.]
MTDPTLTDETARRIFDEHIVPIVFPDQPGGEPPGMTFVVGQPGTAVTRVASRLSDGHAAVLSAVELRMFHPRYLDLSRDGSPESGRILQDSASGWMRSALQHARTNKRSLLLDGTLSSTDAALAATSLFGTSGFTTSVAVVAVPRSESLLALASKYLLDTREGRASPFTTLADHDRLYLGTRALIEALETTPSVNRLTIIDRDGAALFDASRLDPGGFAGALAALDQARATPPSAARAMRWLSELRATTDYALSFRQVPAPLAEVLVQLHEIGRREVLPGLHLPEDSQARPNAEAALDRQLLAIRQASQVERRPEHRPGPSVSTPDVDRGISL